MYLNNNNNKGDFNLNVLILALLLLALVLGGIFSGIYIVNIIFILEFFKNGYPGIAKNISKRKKIFFTLTPIINMFFYKKIIPPGKGINQAKFYLNKRKENKTIFHHPKKIMNSNDKSLFYLRKFSYFNELFLEPKSDNKCYAFEALEKSNLVTFHTIENHSYESDRTQDVVYRIPLTSLRIINYKGSLSHWSLSYNDYKQFYKSNGYVNFLSFSKELLGVFNEIERKPNNPRYLQLLAQHTDTLETIYNTFEESIVTSGSISDKTYNNAIDILKNFSDEILKSSHDYDSKNKVINEKTQVNWEERLEEELKFQNKYILLKK